MVVPWLTSTPGMYYEKWRAGTGRRIARHGAVLVALTSAAAGRKKRCERRHSRFRFQHRESGTGLKFESLNIERQAIATLVKGATLGSWSFRVHSKGLGGGRNKWE